MKNKVFGEVAFNSGWETNTSIEYDGKTYTITVSADAYYEKDGITKEQEESYKDFSTHKDSVATQIKDVMEESFSEPGEYEKYVPVLLLIKRNGEYGLVFDNQSDVEDGVVVVIKPQMEVLSTDQYF